jgi:hypothetical protein
MYGPRVPFKLVKEFAMTKQKTHFEQVPVRVARRVAEVELRKQKSKPPPVPKSRALRSVSAAQFD